MRARPFPRARQGRCLDVRFLAALGRRARSGGPADSHLRTRLERAEYLDEFVSAVRRYAIDPISVFGMHDDLTPYQSVVTALRSARERTRRVGTAVDARFRLRDYLASIGHAQLLAKWAS